MRRALLLLLVLAVNGGARAQSVDVAATDAVELAVDTLRNIDPRALSPAERADLGRALDGAIELLLGNPGAARIAARRELAAQAETERVDSFLVIDLARVLVELEQESLAVLEEVAPALVRVDPGIDPDGFFLLASTMARKKCLKCLPAMGVLLGLDDLALTSAGERLPIDLNMGLSFTIGSFGDAAMPLLRRTLADPSCAVRARSAYLIGMLLPERVPMALRRIATDDGCLDARQRAWVALGMLDEPALPALAEQRLFAEPPPPPSERATIARGLSLSSVEGAGGLIESMLEDADPRLAGEVADALAKHTTSAFDPAALRRLLATAPAKDRASLRIQLQQVGARGDVSLGGSFDDLMSRLSVDDLALLNQARAALLRTVSRSAMTGYTQLTTLARGVRSTREAPASGR